MAYFVNLNSAEKFQHSTAAALCAMTVYNLIPSQTRHSKDPAAV
jgi:hypothetical protein